MYINEIQAYNSHDVLDGLTGNYSDWFELYNNYDYSVDLGGYYLSNDIEIPGMWQVPSGVTIPSKGYVLFWADKLNSNRHTNFSIPGKGGKLLLYNSSFVLIDSVTFPLQYSNISYGRDEEGDNQWYFLKESSPGSNNTCNVLSSMVFTETPEFSLHGGLYEGAQQLELFCSSGSAEIHYTTDGSEPTLTSAIYSAPIVINHNTVIRALSFEPGLMPSEVITNTYLINEDFSLSVFSLVTDHKNLWDSDIGIYTQDNCRKDLERPANIELFDRNGIQGFNHRIGINIFGDYSQILPMKSLAIRFRNKYQTDELNYQLFQDKQLDRFRSFLLRNSGNDWAYSMLRDGLMHSIVKNRMDIDYMEYQPSVVFINGEYWGIHNIREKINEDYLENNHGFDADSITILAKGLDVIEGTSSHYKDLLNYMSTHDLSNDNNFQYVRDRVDIEELNNYQLAQIYFYNQDWPKGNIKKWRPGTPDGKWRWLLFDTDWSFGLFQSSDDMVEWTIGQAKWYLYFNTMMFDNAAYKAEFLQCFQGHMNTTFQPERVINIIDSLKNIIEPEMQRHIDRWGEPASMQEWDKEIEDMKDFARNRLNTLKTNLSNYFYLSGEYTLSANVNNPDLGHIRISNVDIPNNFSGTYYRDLPIHVEAIPVNGYKFTGWSGVTTSAEQEIELTLNNNASITASFCISDTITHLHINECSSKSNNSILDDRYEYEDWIEIYNSGTEPIDLAGLYLTDSVAHLTKSMIPHGYSSSTTVPPNGWLVLYADNDPEQGAQHLNFKLDNDGECILLVQKIGEDHIVLDSIRYFKQFVDGTFGRLPDGFGDWQYVVPTPSVCNIGIPAITGIYLNEFSASNATLIADEHGEYDDWIEIYNDNDYDLDIGGLFITDSLGNSCKHRIPTLYPDSTTVPAKGYLILWSDNQKEQGILHLDFKLSRDGEQIGLVQYGGTEFIDTVSYNEQQANSSLSRYPDGIGSWHNLIPTPGSSNITITITGLFINEFSASNTSLITDNFGEYEDWIEIYNANSVAVDIGGLCLTDSLDFPNKYRIPTSCPDSTIIPPNGYKVLWADGETSQGVLHLDFSLKRKGEQLGLVQQNGSDFIDFVIYEEQYKNASFSRIPDGQDNWQHIKSTPGRSNIFEPVTGIYINEFISSNKSVITDENGEYDDWIEIYNGNDHHVNIGGLFITNSLAQRMKYRIPSTFPDSTTVQPKGHILLWADNQKEQGILHLDFSLKRKGEEIGLLQTTGKTFIDSITYDEQFQNTSTGRYPDGINYWTFMTPSPGASNFINDDYSGLYINEFMASNSSDITDEYGEYDDWIEIYNSNNYQVNIGGMFITDSLADLGKHRIPTLYPDSTTISPYGFLIVWADSDKEQGILHLDFKLSADGGQIGFSRNTGLEYEIIDLCSYGEQSTNISTGRETDGYIRWTEFESPTPGRSNSITAIPLRNNENFYVYPNPVSDGRLYLSEERTVKLYDIQGQLKLIDFRTTCLKVDILQEGIYLLKTDQGEVYRIVIF